MGGLFGDSEQAQASRFAWLTSWLEERFGVGVRRAGGENDWRAGKRVAVCYTFSFIPSPVVMSDFLRREK